MDSDFQYALLLQKQFEQEISSPSKEDRNLALLLQQQFEQETRTENPTSLVYDSKTRSTTRDNAKCLVDPSWEIIDPTPDIHVLFVSFNERFFWNKLLTVCVSWSKRMTSCAGICSYQGRGGMCSITLSEPLLKLRPRKDLVETLLHEMIHAYLFVTHNNRDRDGHGPEFHKHMYRINKEAGTNITVYHDFHDEVRLYKQHWWRCNGPCQNRKPFFGMVRRATNRAPGPNDFWWAEHSRTCGGEFIKVKEPEKKRKKISEKENKKPKVTSPNNTLLKYFPGNNKSNTTVAVNNVHGFDSKGNVTHLNTKDNSQSANTKGFASTAVKKNSSSTIVITKNPTKGKTASPKKTLNKTVNKTPSTSTAQVLGGAKKSDDYSAVRNHWLSKFDNGKASSSNQLRNRKRPPDEHNEPQKKKSKPEMVSCPVCQERKELGEIDAHLDDCLKNPNNEKMEDCVGCGNFFPKSALQGHVSECLSASFSDDFEVNTSFKDRLVSADEMERHLLRCPERASEGEKRDCPVCNGKVSEGDFDAHVETCLHKMYDDIERRNSEDSGVPEESGGSLDQSIRHEFETSCSDDEAVRKYNCPFCFKMFLEEEMCDHITKCVQEYVAMVDGEDKSVLVDELNNDSL